MKYTIINTLKDAKFIQQDYTEVKDANARLKALSVKFKAQHEWDETTKGALRLVVVGVDADGVFHSLEKAADKGKAPVKP